MKWSFVSQTISKCGLSNEITMHLPNPFGLFMLYLVLTTNDQITKTHLNDGCKLCLFHNYRQFSAINAKCYNANQTTIMLLGGRGKPENPEETRHNLRLGSNSQTFRQQAPPPANRLGYKCKGRGVF